MYAKPKKHIILQYAYTAKQLKTSQHGSLICAVCLVYYHSLLKVQTDSQVSLSEVLLKFVISDVWCLQCRCPVWSGYTNSIIMQYLLHQTPATVHRLTPWISWPRCIESPTASGPIFFLVKASVTFSTVTLLLVFFLGRCELFSSASAAKHTNTNVELLQLSTV